MQSTQEAKVGSVVYVEGRKGTVVRKSETHGENPYHVFSVKFNENETRNYAIDKIDEVVSADAAEDDDEGDDDES